jgi:radical SAM protein with 4Fe4S-binding SPASM domain
MLLRDINIYNDIEPVLEINRNCQRCGLGTSFGSIGYDGNIYGCQEQDSKGTDNIFYIGNIFNGGINKKLHIKLLSEYHQKNKRICSKADRCKNCLLRNICIEFNCPSTSYDLYSKFEVVNEIECLWFEQMLISAIKINNKLVKQNNLLFKNYLDKTCNFEKYWIGGKDNGC